MRRLLFLFLLLVSIAGNTQDLPQLKSYVEETGMQIPLLRAPVALPCAFPYNGTYLVDTLGFLEGSLVYEGKLYPGLLLNLDAVSQHVLVRRPESPVSFDMGQDPVSSFTRGGRNYVNLSALGLDVHPGFYRVEAQGRGTLYCKVSKVLQHLPNLDATAQRYIGYDDPHYTRNLADYFAYRETWYLVREDGSVQRLRSKRKIRKARQYVLSSEAL